MKRKHTKIAAILICCLAILTLASCGSNHNQSATNDDTQTQGEASDTAGTEESGGDTGSSSEDSSESYDPWTQYDPEKSDQKLSYSCSVDLETKQYSKVISDLHDEIDRCDGIVYQEETSHSDPYWYYSEENKPETGNVDGLFETHLTVKIPSKNYQDFLDALNQNEGIHIVSRTQNVADITQSYVDNNSEIQVLENRQQRLTQMMQQATSLTDKLELESSLTEVERELIQAKSDKSGLTDYVTYSTVELTITEVQEYTKASDHSFGSRVTRALSKAWKGFVHFWQGFVIFLIYLIPVLIVLAAFFFLIRFITRKVRKKSGKQGSGGGSGSHKGGFFGRRGKNT
ncbi:MAG: DUF4349 domain-containing protein [Bilifractor sp.]|jgi:hypothetical protein